MPIPSSPAEWDALDRTETDVDIVVAYCEAGRDNRHEIAAASRLLERERADAEHEAAIHAAALRGARLALEAAAARAEMELELEGPPPKEISADFKDTTRATNHLRAVVRATKASIADGIRKLSAESIVKGGTP